MFKLLLTVLSPDSNIQFLIAAIAQSCVLYCPDRFRFSQDPFAKTPELSKFLFLNLSSLHWSELGFTCFTCRLKLCQVLISAFLVCFTACFLSSQNNHPVQGNSASDQRLINLGTGKRNVKSIVICRTRKYNLISRQSDILEKFPNIEIRLDPEETRSSKMGRRLGINSQWHVYLRFDELCFAMIMTSRGVQGVKVCQDLCSQRQKPVHAISLTSVTHIC